jgi:large subunit ribosomal protein L23
VITLNKDPRDILLAPVVSEKSYGLLDEGKYTFIVDPRANKTEIKIAVAPSSAWASARTPSARSSPSKKARSTSSGVRSDDRASEV